MIELTTVNGFRRMVRVDQVSQIAELPDSKRSNTVITLENGETIFAANSYNDVKEMYDLSRTDLEIKQEPTSGATEISHHINQ